MSSFHIFSAILVLHLVICNAYRPSFSDFSTMVDISSNVEYDTEEVVSSHQFLGPPPVYPEGESEFARGTIDLGGLEVFKAKYFKKIWETQSGGPNNLGASFYEPTNLPTGFHLLGHYCKLNTKAMFDAVLTAKDTTRDPWHGATPALKSPVDYSLVWTSKGTTLDIGQDVVSCYIWLPIPPRGYKTVGHIVTTSPLKPSLDKVKCVRSDLTDLTEVGEKIWNSNNINLYSTKAVSINGRPSVPTGTFLALNHRSGGYKLASLKVVKNDTYSAHPSNEQIKVMLTAYAPLVYFHSKEEFFPSSVSWFFKNGGLLVIDNKPHGIINDGDNLPRDGTIDDSFLDLPLDEALQDKVKKGSLTDAVAYIHAKPTQDGTFTDIAIWLYYPFHGRAKFQVGPLNINLGKIGEHVGDWEHTTLRIDNFGGSLSKIYLSQHSKGTWVSADKFEYINGRPVVYASLHGHAHYNAPGNYIHYNAEDVLSPSEKQMLIREFQSVYPTKSADLFSINIPVGPFDETEKGNVFDILASPSSYELVSFNDGAEYTTPPPWLDYTGRWGPKINYVPKKVVLMIIRFSPLPLWAKLIAKQVVLHLPDQVFREEGPEGPKFRPCWNGDEIE